MGKLIVDEIVQDLLNDAVDSSVGLLIGTVKEDSQFCIAHIAQTYEERDNEDEILKWKSVGEIIPAQVTHHAKQVIRMLPGGLYVIGLYVKEKAEIFTSKYENILKSLITSVNKGLSRNVYYCSDYRDDKIILHFDGKKTTAKAMDNNFKIKPIEVANKKLEWLKLECEYDTVSAMHLGKNALPLKKNLQMLLKTFEDTLDAAKFLIEGDVPDKDVIYEEAEEKEKEMSEDEGGGGDFQEDEPFPVNRPVSPIHILIDKVPGILKPEAGDGHEDFVEHLHFQGKIVAVAFVVAGSSRLHIVKMLKEDILRSMSSRIEMHCESLVDEDHSEDASKVYHEVPRRVFVYLPSRNILVSDYLFPGEGPQDSLVSFRDLLSLDIQDCQVIVNKEIPFDMDELQLRGSMEELLSKAESITKLQNGVGNRKNIAYLLALALIIAFLSICVPLLRSN